MQDNDRYSEAQQDEVLELCKDMNDQLVGSEIPIALAAISMLIRVSFDKLYPAPQDKLTAFEGLRRYVFGEFDHGRH